MELTRLIVTKPDGTYVGEVDPTRVVGADFVREVNGEHSITLSTFDELGKNDRILWCDEMGAWHENVVEGLDGEHGEHGDTLHEYWCPWSLQHDLAATFVTAMPGTGGTPAPSLAALQAALGGTERWQVGTVTQTSSGSASMWRVSGWEAMQTLVEVWGGELSATIDVGGDGVVGRYVNLLAHVGATVPTRRFDYGGDLLGIRRKVADQPWTCRVLPLGKAQETEGGGYGRKTTIESVNGGIPWLEDELATPLVRVPDGEGWEYPTQIVENPDLDDPAALKAWALEHLTDWTTPKVSYEVDVLQLSQAGVDATGVAEGDEVVVVDHGFSSEGLAIQGRALRIEGSLLDPTQTKLTISNLTDTLGGQLGSIARSVARLEDQQRATSLYQATADYLSELLGRLNGEINSSGGYTYITEGQGIRCYDAAVSDPLVGAEATKVVEIKGGTIRIADTKTAQGEWNWRTVFVSGHIAADLVTAANITAGHIGSADSGNYLNLDTGEFRLASTAQLGSMTVQQVVDGIDNTITGVDIQYAQGTSATVAPTTGWSSTPPAWEAGKYIWQRTATTTAAGTTYSTPVMISGKDGADGTSVTILGSYNTLAELQAAHPTGNMGDGYMVGPDLYVWNGSAWEDVGQIQGPQGPQGPQGATGTASTVTSVEYGTSASALVTPTNWTTTVPTSIADGTWLWVRTTYSTGQVSVTKSYSGTDGADGTDGTDGADGADGADGIGVTAIVEQYYLSTSSSAVTGGSWSNTQQAYVSGKYYWTRSRITWSDTSVTTTTPVLAQGLNNANAVATTTKADLDVLNTQEGVFNKLTDNGALQGLYMDNGQLYINATYMKSGFLGNADNSSYFDLDNGEIVVHDAYYGVYYQDMRFKDIQFTDNYGMLNGDTTEQTEKGLQLAHRRSVNGTPVTHNLWLFPSLPRQQHNLFQSTLASTLPLAIAGNMDTLQSANSMLYLSSSVNLKAANSTRSAYLAHSAGSLTIGGEYNGTSVNTLSCTYNIGNNTASASFYGTARAVAWTNLSDRRVKEHVSDIGEDAAEFVRGLRPIAYRFKGSEDVRVGFYAQDVEEVDPWGSLVGEYDPDADDGGMKSLDYTQLIAPLVAYCQQLERRIEALEGRA